MSFLRFATVVTVFAAAATCSPSPGAQQHESWEAADKSICASQMDGRLPGFVPSNFNFSGNVRQYFVAATEEEWDYVPSGWDNIRGVPLNSSNEGMMYVASNSSLGSKYIKGLYRGYTDSTFKNRSEQPAWLGLQGPIMRAEVGDMIEVLLYNNFTSDDVSMHSMGLFYTKDSEGSDYYNTTTSDGKASFSKGEAIPPGECFVYKWLVSDSSSPLPTQASKLWTYHGDINLQQDIDTGLIGPSIIYQRGQMNETLAHTREFVLFYASTTESDSVFFGKSVQRFLPSAFKNDTGDVPTPSSTKNASIWEPMYQDQPNMALPTSLAQSPTHINGYLYANLQGLELCIDEHVTWHVYTFGVFDDGYHVFHPHGNNIQIASGENMAQVPLLPATMTTVQMVGYNPGIFNLLCHDGDHFEQGMVTNYRVYHPNKCPADVSRCKNIMM